jgi:hypothetical protein
VKFDGITARCHVEFILDFNSLNPPSLLNPGFVSSRIDELTGRLTDIKITQRLAKFFECRSQDLIEFQSFLPTLVSPYTKTILQAWVFEFNQPEE